MRCPDTVQAACVHTETRRTEAARGREIFSCDVNRIYDTINEAATYALNMPLVLY